MGSRRSITPEEIQVILDLNDVVSDDESEFKSSDEGENDSVDNAQELSDIVYNVEVVLSDNESHGEKEIKKEEYGDSYFMSKNKVYKWNKVEVMDPEAWDALNNISCEKAGPSKFADLNVDTLSSAFQLYFREPLMDTILKWTNLEGKSEYGAEWIPVSRGELNKVIGILLLTGVYRGKNESIKHLWSLKEGRKIFGEMMSRTRFLTILRVLRFDNARERRKNRSEDRLEPIRECFQMWNRYLHEAYIPSWSLTVDEQLVPFRGRCPFKQYVPSKPGKCGLRIWAICDSITSYAWKLEISIGKRDTKETNQGENVIKRLTEEVENTGRNITCNNFFTSYDLAMHLLSKNLTLVGTVRKNKPEIPISFTDPKNREVYSTLFGFQERATIISYCPKKGEVVTLLSTMHNKKSIDDSPKKKPDVIIDYNKTKGAVDSMDKIIRTYSVKCMTRRWPLLVFYHMIDISAMNAFIIWLSLGRPIEKKIRNRRDFIIELGKELAGYETEHVIIPIVPVTEAPPAKRSRCGICPTKRDRKTRSTCSKCKKNICKEHSEIICNICAY